MRKSLKTRRADLFAEAWLSAVYQKVKDLTVPVKESQLVATWMEREYGEAGIEAARDRRHKGALLGDAEAIREGIEKGKQVQLHHGVAGSAAPRRCPAEWPRQRPLHDHSNPYPDSTRRGRRRGLHPRRQETLSP